MIKPTRLIVTPVHIMDGWTIDIISKQFAFSEIQIGIPIVVISVKNSHIVEIRTGSEWEKFFIFRHHVTIVYAIDMYAGVAFRIEVKDILPNILIKVRSGKSPLDDLRRIGAPVHDFGQHGFRTLHILKPNLAAVLKLMPQQYPN